VIEDKQVILENQLTEDNKITQEDKKKDEYESKLREKWSSFFTSYTFKTDIKTVSDIVSAFSKNLADKLQLTMKSGKIQLASPNSQDVNEIYAKLVKFHEYPTFMQFMLYLCEICGFLATRVTPEDYWAFDNYLCLTMTAVGFFSILNLKTVIEREQSTDAIEKPKSTEMKAVTHKKILTKEVDAKEDLPAEIDINGLFVNLSTKCSKTFSTLVDQYPSFKSPVVISLLLNYPWILDLDDKMKQLRE